jgi:hypothetical protein
LLKYNNLNFLLKKSQMKNFLFIGFLTFSIGHIGCKNEQAKPPTTESTTIEPPKVVEPQMTGAASTACYQLIEASKDKHTCQIVTRATPNPFVSGYMDWSPFQKDGGHGVLKNGKIENGMLVADWTYMIEGSVQTEVVYIKIEGNKITKMRGELIEKDNKLVAKDPTKLKPKITLAKVDCAKIEETIKNIQQMEAQLK